MVRYFVAGLMSQKMSKFLLYLACNLEIKIRGTSLCLEYAFSFVAVMNFSKFSFAICLGKMGHQTDGRSLAKANYEMCAM